MRSLLRGRDEDKQPEIAVELYFDEATEDAILELRDVLYDVEIVTEPGVIESRPHISLTILQGDEIPFDLLHAFASETAKRPVQLTSLASFGAKEGVVFLAPTPDDRLLDLHRDLHQRLDRSAFASRASYRPKLWVPHCTIEKDIPLASLARALEALLERFEPIEGELVDVGAVRYPPLEAVEIAALSGSDADT